MVVGLGLLIAFNRPPLLLGGTKWIVILAHAVLVLAFTVSTVTAGLDRLDPAYEQAARSLGAGEARVLLRVRLPLLLQNRLLKNNNSLLYKKPFLAKGTVFL